MAAENNSLTIQYIYFYHILYYGKFQSVYVCAIQVISTNTYFTEDRRLKSEGKLNLELPRVFFHPLRMGTEEKQTFLWYQLLLFESHNLLLSRLLHESAKRFPTSTPEVRCTREQSILYPSIAYLVPRFLHHSWYTTERHVQLFVSLVMLLFHKTELLCMCTEQIYYFGLSGRLQDTFGSYFYVR